jgi:hypothetical protein
MESAAPVKRLGGTGAKRTAFCRSRLVDFVVTSRRPPFSG